MPYACVQCWPYGARNACISCLFWTCFTPTKRPRQVVDAFKASYGVDNALYAVGQLAQTTMRRCYGRERGQGDGLTNGCAAGWQLTSG